MTCWLRAANYPTVLDYGGGNSYGDAEVWYVFNGSIFTDPFSNPSDSPEPAVKPVPMDYVSGNILDVYVTFDYFFSSAAGASWGAAQSGTITTAMADLTSPGDSDYSFFYYLFCYIRATGTSPTGYKFYTSTSNPNPSDPIGIAYPDAWTTFKVKFPSQGYVQGDDGSGPISAVTFAANVCGVGCPGIGAIQIGQSALAEYSLGGGFTVTRNPVDPDSVVLMDNVKIGTSWGASDILEDDFETGDLSKWTTSWGDVSVVCETPKLHLEGVRNLVVNP